MNQRYADIRKEYRGQLLRQGDCLADPIEQFHRWFEHAERAGEEYVNGASLATVGTMGRPSLRVVLVKGVSQEGFRFYTNYQSRKGQDLTDNPFASLCFWWQSLHRQVRIDGEVARLADAESDTYFQSRPRDSNLAAMASSQSQPIASRVALERAFSNKQQECAEQPLQRPGSWGGFALVPSRIEFWQGRESRLHDRIEYTLAAESAGTKTWKMRRLQP